MKFQQEDSVQSSSKDGEAAATPLEGITHTLKDGEAAATPLEGTTHTLKDGEAAAAPLEDTTHTLKDDELLLDIQFPDCGPQDSPDWSFNTAHDISASLNDYNVHLTQTIIIDASLCRF